VRKSWPREVKAEDRTRAARLRSHDGGASSTRSEAEAEEKEWRWKREHEQERRGQESYEAQPRLYPSSRTRESACWDRLRAELYADDAAPRPLAGSNAREQSASTALCISFLTQRPNLFPRCWCAFRCWCYRAVFVPLSLLVPQLLIVLCLAAFGGAVTTPISASMIGRHTIYTNNQAVRRSCRAFLFV
jgi:hypothetical protein